MEYKKNLKRGVARNIAIIVIAIIAIIVISIIIIIVKNKNNLIVSNQITNEQVSKSEDTLNYIEGTDEAKYNVSEKVVEDKKVENILIQNSKIVYSKGVSKLTAKVTNDNVAKENLRLKIKFIANDGSVIAETIGLIGKIEANESKYIDSSITKDITNTKEITFEIIK